MIGSELRVRMPLNPRAQVEICKIVAPGFTEDYDRDGKRHSLFIGPVNVTNAIFFPSHALAAWRHISFDLNVGWNETALIIEPRWLF